MSIYTLIDGTSSVWTLLLKPDEVTTVIRAGGKVYCAERLCLQLTAGQITKYIGVPLRPA